MNPTARLIVYGQELNAETYAVCRADMMLKNQPGSNIHLGDSFREDAFVQTRFDYLMANHLLVEPGRRNVMLSKPSMRSSASPAASVRERRGSTTARSCSSST